MRLTLFAIFALGTAAFAQHHGATGSYGNVLHPGVPSPGALRAPSPRPGPWSHGSVFQPRPPLLRRQRRLRPLSNMDTASVSITSIPTAMPPVRARAPRATRRRPRPPSSSTRISRPNPFTPFCAITQTFRSPSPALFEFHRARSSRRSTHHLPDRHEGPHHPPRDRLLGRRRDAPLRHPPERPQSSEPGPSRPRFLQETQRRSPRPLRPPRRPL